MPPETANALTHAMSDTRRDFAREMIRRHGVEGAAPYLTELARQQEREMQNMKRCAYTRCGRLFPSLWTGKYCSVECRQKAGAGAHDQAGETDGVG